MLVVIAVVFQRSNLSLRSKIGVHRTSDRYRIASRGMRAGDVGGGGQRPL